MKKIVCLLVSLFLLTSVNAKTVKIEDFSVDLDDESWHIVTKDNIKGNEDIKELGITEEYMENFMKTYSAYMDSMLMYDEENFVEFAVIAKKSDVKYNMHKYSDKDVKKFGEEMIKISDATDYEVFKSNGYVYIKTKYEDNNYNLYLTDYYTVINGKVFTLKFQQTNEISNEDTKMFDSVVNTVKYDLNKEYDKEPKNFLEKVFSGAITGGLCGLLIAGILKVFKKKDKNEKVNELKENRK